MTDTNKLEQWIDNDGLAFVLSKIADICYEKAQHIEEQYGNNDAEEWYIAADDIADLSENMPS